MMIAVAGHLFVSANQRDDYVAAFTDLVQWCREARGCLEVSVAADSVDPRRVNTLEIWTSQADLDSWRSRADGPEPDIEIEDMNIKEYVINHYRDPFTTD